MSTHAFPLPPAFTETWLSPRDSASLLALLFQIPALLLSSLYQLHTDSTLLPFPSSSINLNDFIIHLCLLVLVCFSGMSSTPPQSYFFPTMRCILPSPRIIPLLLWSYTPLTHSYPPYPLPTIPALTGYRRPAPLTAPSFPSHQIHPGLPFFPTHPSSYGCPSDWLPQSTHIFVLF